MLTMMMGALRSKSSEQTPDSVPGPNDKKIAGELLKMADEVKTALNMCFVPQELPAGEMERVELLKELTQVKALLDKPKTVDSIIKARTILAAVLEREYRLAVKIKACYDRVNPGTPKCNPSLEAYIIGAENEFRKRARRARELLKEYPS